MQSFLDAKAKKVSNCFVNLIQTGIEGMRRPQLTKHNENISPEGYVLSIQNHPFSTGRKGVVLYNSSVSCAFFLGPQLHTQ